MNECTICKNRSNPMQFDLPQYARDEKLAFVERVCGLLIESRFGPGRMYEMVTYLQPKPDGRTDVFFLATDEGFLPAYDVGYMQDSLLDAIEEDLALRHGIVFGNPATHRRSTLTLARGSPGIA